MNILPAPEKFKNDVKIWADEAIWGHRFYNDQTPWLVFLEFLAVFRSRRNLDKALNESCESGAHEFIQYNIPRLIPLRELIFNNPHIQFVNQDKRSIVNDKWSAWNDLMNKDLDYTYLKERFENFSQLTHVIEYFQNTAIEPHRKRRWTSRFIFPYGPDCLFADLPVNPTQSPDRRFFGRGGELLYLMLCRSGAGPEIAELINEQLIPAEDTWNQIAKTALLPDNYNFNDVITNNNIGYLPYPARDEYQELASTMIHILKLDLPSTAKFDPLVRLSSLHMLLYMLRRANEEIGDISEPKFVLEIATPQKTSLFELSSDSLKANNMASLRAVRAHVKNVKSDHGWNKAVNERVPSQAVHDFLQQRFAWEPDGSLDRDPDKIFSQLLTYAIKRHKQHVAKIHSEWTRQIGLTVSRRGVGKCYRPSDSLLKALVMVTVQGHREEYHRFLSKLYENFRLVIAAPEAEKAFGQLPIDQHVFAQNAQRLEQRLSTLGLLRRLSDDCAYVENPFQRRL
ncbi:MAG: hypothetical protein OXE59_06180 [Bacteroidetes bacterium]|nr:hypothetical protein [Bacteroidota bacterium]